MIYEYIILAICRLLNEKKIMTKKYTIDFRKYCIIYEKMKKKKNNNKNIN